MTYWATGPIGEQMRERLRRLGGGRVARLAGRLDEGELAILTGVAGRLDRRIAPQLERRRVNVLGDEDWLQWLYEDALGREADAMGLEYWRQRLHDGMPRDAVARFFLCCDEAVGGRIRRAGLEGFHASRVIFTRSLPPARRILDLGGTSLESVLGSLLVMGYPYVFDDLAIIDLPSSERHSLYQAGDNEDLLSPLGPVRYLFRSMVDLDDLADGSVDLVVSGQTFEHITAQEGEVLLGQVARLLSADGVLALDTPNRAVTAIECATTGLEFINPDHKIEYTHTQLLALFAAAGLEVERAYGLGYMPGTVRSGTWQPEELAVNRGMYAAIEQCYALAYLVRRRRNHIPGLPGRPSASDGPVLDHGAG